MMHVIENVLLSSRDQNLSNAVNEMLDTEP